MKSWLKSYDSKIAVIYDVSSDCDERNNMFTKHVRALVINFSCRKELGVGVGLGSGLGFRG